MNKEELINKWESKLNYFKGCPFGKFQRGQMWEIQEILIDLKRLGESESPIIPKNVAGLIEEYKGRGSFLYDLIRQAELRLIDCVSAIDFINGNQDMIEKAWFYGYEIEEEKKYTARLKLINEDVLSYLIVCDRDGEYFLASLDNSGNLRTHFTKKELEDINVWNSDQWEIEEVG